MEPDLVCPIDQLALKDEGESLACEREHRWQVECGIPRIVSAQHNYSDAFGLQWGVYKKTQLDSHTGLPISRERARRCLGEALWSRLESPEPCRVLEVGCGAGRFTEVLLDTPAARVTSVDFSSAVEANQDNFPQGDTHRIVQADVLELPFSPQQFEVVFCLGVIQHTPSPEETIARLYEQVRPGGWLLIDHYTYSLVRLTKLGQVLRPILKRLSPEAGLRWTERLVKTFFPLHRGVRRSRLLQLVLGRFSPVLSYLHTYPELSEQLQYEFALLDTHDSLTDWYKHSRTMGQIERLLRGLAAVDIECAYAGNGVEARCRRPRDGSRVRE